MAWVSEGEVCINARVELRVALYDSLVVCQLPKTKPGVPTYASLFAPMKPPRPMLIAPANSSASPPSTTTLVSPKPESPAVNANGTVSPSLSPMMASDIILGLSFHPPQFSPSYGGCCRASISASAWDKVVGLPGAVDSTSPASVKSSASDQYLCSKVELTFHGTIVGEPAIAARRRWEEDIFEQREYHDSNPHR